MNRHSHHPATLWSALVLVSGLAFPLETPRVLVFEAEDVSGPAGLWLTNKLVTNRWNLWSTDQDAQKKWSGGVVLQSPPVLADRKSGDEGAPVLHTRIAVTNGPYDVTLKMSRTLGISRDGGLTWERTRDGALGEVVVTNGFFELWVDDRFVNLPGPGSAYFDNIQLRPVLPLPVKPAVQGHARVRVSENLDRGLVAFRDPSGGVCLSFRFLKEDGVGMAFHLLRKRPTGETTEITSSALSGQTSFCDTHAPEGVLSYAVVPVLGGARQKPSAFVGLSPLPPTNGVGYISIPLESGTTVQKVALGDLDGDGRYDFVLKTPNENIDPYELFWKKSPETYHLQARNADGVKLWESDLGWAIERGIWYSPYVVGDLDGDGKAEVVVKMGEGDPRGPDGRVNEGPEWVVVLDGLTGMERARAPWPSRSPGGEALGYNFASRNQLGIAYLDGKTPCVIVERGTYTVIQVHAFQFAGKTLEMLWNWNSLEEKNPSQWKGQGAHTLQAHDVDGDGRDEVVLGSAVLGPNGRGLWSTGRGHPDHCYVGDIIPSRPGLEIFYGMETAQAESNGMCVVEAATGKTIWSLPGATRHVHGTGFCADIDPRNPGLEVYGCDTDPLKNFERGWLCSSTGAVLEATKDLTSLRPLWWLGNDRAQLLKGERLLEYPGKKQVGQIKGSAVLIADAFGDWREEIFTSLPGELRIYTPLGPISNREITPMQDPVYRATVLAASEGYFYNAMRSGPARREGP